MNPSPVLLVSDWNLAPEAVVDAARCRHPSAGLYLLVPARLRGLDWVGDPYASVPCARRQLDAIARLAARAGLNLVEASVGDPDPITAIGDALADWPAQQLLVCASRGRLGARTRSTSGPARTGCPACPLAALTCPTPMPHGAATACCGSAATAPLTARRRRDSLNRDVRTGRVRALRRHNVFKED